MRKTAALFSILCIGMASAAWSLNATVKKDGTGDVTTVQDGLNLVASGGQPMGTVTILDSATYDEDLTIMVTVHDGITLKAAPGERPRIRAANTAHRWDFLVAPGTMIDYMGIMVATHCTIEGIDIQQAALVPNLLGFSAALTVESLPGAVNTQCTVRNCRLWGPGVDVGTVVSAVHLSWGTDTHPETTYEGCDFSTAVYCLVNVNFGPPAFGLGLLPVYTVFGDPITTMTDCVIQNNVADGADCMAGEMYFDNCVFRYNGEDGVEIGGGTCYFTGCDFTDNDECGLLLEFAEGDYNLGRANFPVAIATDCLFARNLGGGQDGSLRIDEGMAAMSRSIISQPVNTWSIFMDDNVDVGPIPTPPSPCTLVMDFCDIFGPTQNAIGFGTDVKEHDIPTTITNSVIVAVDGWVNPDSSFISGHVENCVLWCSGIPTSGVTVVNCETTKEPIYLLPYGGTRDGFYYLNTDLNIGMGGQDVGSQGHFEIGPMRARHWALYN